MRDLSTDISFLNKGEIAPFRPWEKKDLQEELEGLKTIVRGFRTDCLILNHTPPMLQFPVGRVVIPGVSDFLPFLPPTILTDETTKPATAWKGEVFRRVMKGFFAHG